jgi:hypothetical protein
MKFKLHENLPLEIADAFQTLGHELETVQGEGLVGAPNTEILNHARTEGRILLTMDKGIADIRLLPPATYPGIVLFRPATSGRGEVRCSGGLDRSLIDGYCGALGDSFTPRDKNPMTVRIRQFLPIACNRVVDDLRQFI